MEPEAGDGPGAAGGGQLTRSVEHPVQASAHSPVDALPTASSPTTDDAAALLLGDAAASLGPEARAAARAAREGAARAAAQGLGVRLAGELFRPERALSHRTRGDISALGQTSCVQNTWRLRRDFERIAEGSAAYWPCCLCASEDRSLFRALHAELAPWDPSPYRRSRHPACVEEAKLLGSKTYRHVVAVLRGVFGLTVGYSIANLYADGDDWTDYHRDNYRAEGNRMGPAGASGVEAHNVTVGASFGDSRELRFKHLETGLEFGFPQGNGDVFAFSEPVNSAFQHCIPRATPASAAGPRISVILWGRVGDPAALGPTGLGGREPRRR